MSSYDPPIPQLGSMLIGNRVHRRRQLIRNYAMIVMLSLENRLVGSLLLVGLSRGLVGVLVQLVADVVLASGGTVAEADVAVLGDFLVGLSGGLVGELGSLV